MAEHYNKILWFILLLVLINIFLTNFVVISLPGEVIPIQATEEAGFFLTTIAMGSANLWRVLYAVLAPEASMMWNFTGYFNGRHEFEKSQQNACLVVKNYLFQEKQVKVQPILQDIKGGSGGLMFALAYYDQVTDFDLSQGLRISGSGTLTEEGLVEPVQGVKQKVLAAKEHQIDIFFVHPDNFSQARAANTEVLLVPVTSFQQALSFLLDTNKQSLYNL